MKTFLEFVIESLLGEPTSSQDNGESNWPCPNCGHPDTFHTMPRKGGKKDRFKCWVCNWPNTSDNFRGDEHDILKFFHPHEHKSDRDIQLAALRLEYEKALEAEPSLSPGETGKLEMVKAMVAAWKTLTLKEVDVIAAAVEIMKKKAPDIPIECWVQFVSEAPAALRARGHRK